MSGRQKYTFWNPFKRINFFKKLVSSDFVYGVLRPLEFETTNKIFIFLFVQKFNYCLNNKIDVVIWADHNFSAKLSIKILSLESDSTCLKTPWTKCELPVPFNNGKVTF